MTDILTFDEAKERLGIKPMTNEEWLRNCTTEELAKYLQSISVLSLESKDEDLEDWKRWLKEKHE